MIGIWLSEPDFEYDIFSLTKAFVGKEEVKIEIGEGKNPVEEILSFSKRFSTWIGIFYKEDGMEFSYSIEGQEKKLFEKIEAKSSRLSKKNSLKRSLYGILQELTKKTLPWGTLTGIRPTKIFMSHLEAGMEEESLFDFMKKEYFISDEKNRLSIEIAKKEQYVLRNINYEDGYSLYIGIPFCPTTCLYCSFTSYPLDKWKNKMEEYVETVCKEIVFTESVYRHKKLNTIYIGGGTPTTLPPNLLDRLLTCLEETFSYQFVEEVTVEAGRPDSMTQEKLEVLKKHHVTRISINPQTMKQETLDLIGRRHTVEELKSAYEMARNLGFDNINMDLILGLPNENIEDVKHTLAEVSKLNPDSITVHSLALKRAARLKMFEKDYEEYTMENTDEIMNLTEDFSRNMGMEPYYLYRQKNIAGNLENVGYSKADKEGIYNILIMEELQTIIALGAGSVSKFPGKNGKKGSRSENVKDIDLYLNRIDEMIERKRVLMES